jgi:hypothetical protein
MTAFFESQSPMSTEGKIERCYIAVAGGGWWLLLLIGIEREGAGSREEGLRWELKERGTGVGVGSAREAWTR